ncbi:MAG: hypothetical protein RLZZ327_131 [Actinomycetota bacterium]
MSRDVCRALSARLASAAEYGKSAAPVGSEDPARATLSVKSVAETQRAGGAYIKPPSVHNALAEPVRTSPTGVRLRSQISW